jgi:hypothetical protein
MDLGARSLVGGVDCNGPEKSPFLDLFDLFVLCIMHHHASSTLHVL